MSFGISTKTGPGLPVVATSKAKCKTLERSFASFTNPMSKKIINAVEKILN